MLLVVVSVIDPERGRAWHLPALSLLFPAWYYFLSVRLGGLHRPDRPALP